MTHTARAHNPKSVDAPTTTSKNMSAAVAGQAFELSQSEIQTESPPRPAANQLETEYISGMTETTPSSLVLKYFDAVEAADRSKLRALLAEDAEMVSINAGLVKGADAILAYYEANFFRTGGRIRPQTGPLICNANTVAVEVQAHSESGKVSWLADFFTVDNGLIQQLHVYYGPDFKEGHEQS